MPFPTRDRPPAFWEKGIIPREEWGSKRVHTPPECHKYMDDENALPIEIGYHEHVGWFVVLPCGTGPVMLWHSRDLATELRDRAFAEAEENRKQREEAEKHPL